jgi:hypothetical protein
VRVPGYSRLFFTEHVTSQPSQATHGRAEMNSRKPTTIWKVLLYSLLAVDAGLLAAICWLDLIPPAVVHAQTSSQFPELDKNGKPITPESVLALMPGTAPLVNPADAGTPSASPSPGA